MGSHTLVTLSVSAGTLPRDAGGHNVLTARSCGGNGRGEGESFGGSTLCHGLHACGASVYHHTFRKQFVLEIRFEDHRVVDRKFEKFVFRRGEKHDGVLINHGGDGVKIQYPRGTHGEPAKLPTGEKVSGSSFSHLGDGIARVCVPYSVGLWWAGSFPALLSLRSSVRGKAGVLECEFVP